MKIAIVVQGRFHAFDLTRELLNRGHDVTLFTNYPRWAVSRFDVPAERVRGFVAHGLLTRANQKLPRQPLPNLREASLHQLFGRWAATQLSQERWDVVHIWSGVAEESLRELRRASGATTLLMRGSAHIRSQQRLLEEEEVRTRTPQDRPSHWMLAREEREYDMADAVVVLSTFSYNTFLDQGVPAERLRLLPLGARLSTFRPPSEVVEARRQRILSGAPLRVLYVGSLSYRKGLWDLARVASSVSPDDFQLRLVGPQLPEVDSVVAGLPPHVIVSGKQPQADLPEVYAWADLFVFPTIEDGYPTVLAQAAASGLPILTTPNGSGFDLVREGETGWIVPIRSPELLLERLGWSAAHRPELAAIADQVYGRFQPRDWADVAADFEALCARRN